jgi:T5SS/PEP-CTERM-associated repeat protein/autotransporter-associated beta strand protein
VILQTNSGNVNAPQSVGQIVRLSSVTQTWRPVWGPILTIHGINGIGVDDQLAVTVPWFHYNVDLGGSQTWRSIGTGAFWSSNAPSYINVKSYDLTLDIRNAAGIGQYGHFRGSGNVIKTGPGTFQLNNASTLTGAVTVDQGTLTLVAGGSLATASVIGVNGGGTFDISGITPAGTSIRRLGGSGAVALGAKTLTLTNANDVFSGSISGTGGLAISGGTQTLTGANTYTGETYVTGGTALDPSRLVVAGVNASIGSAAANVTVGRFSGDNAALTIESGGSVSSNDGIIGSDAGSSGAVTVRGAGSTWTNTDDISVGYDGVGRLTVESGGSVSSTDGIIGSNVGSSGTVTMRGAGSSWTIANYLEVGPYGNGSLTIEDSGKVSNSVGVVGGRQAGSSGAVTVTGSGSQWTNTDLYVGNAGTGLLTVENGGTVDANNSWIGSQTGCRLNLGQHSGPPCGQCWHRQPHNRGRRHSLQPRWSARPSRRFLGRGDGHGIRLAVDQHHRSLRRQRWHR